MFQILPLEIIFEILTFLDDKSVCNSRIVCKKWKLCLEHSFVKRRKDHLQIVFEENPSLNIYKVFGNEMKKRRTIIFGTTLQRDIYLRLINLLDIKDQRIVSISNYQEFCYYDDNDELFNNFELLWIQRLFEFINLKTLSYVFKRAKINGMTVIAQAQHITMYHKEYLKWFDYFIFTSYDYGWKFKGLEKIWKKIGFYRYPKFRERMEFLGKKIQNQEGAIVIDTVKKRICWIQK